MLTVALDMDTGRTVEDKEQVPLLACLDWKKLHRATGHIPGLWESVDALAAVPSIASS